jgi:hypothetical protein
MIIKKYILFILCCAIFTLPIGCQKEKEAVLTVCVLNPNNFPVAGIGFDILDENDFVSYRNRKQISASNEEIRLTLTKGKTYYINLLASEDYPDWYMGNTAATLKSVGTFKSTQEIDQSAIQKPTPKVGDTKYADFNGDGAINIDDLILKVDLQDDIRITVNLITGRKAYYKI